MMYIQDLNRLKLPGETMSVLKNLDLNLLIIFEAIYTSENVSHAAKKLGVSQPTISNSLARLRETLEDPLFIRAGRGVAPTPKAVQMIGPIREALQMIAEGVENDNDFDPKTSKRHFRVAMLDPVEAIIMPQIIHQFQDYKSTSIEAYGLAGIHLVDGLNDGSLDIVLANFLSDIEDIQCIALAQPHLVMVARKGHPRINVEFTIENYRELGHVALVRKMRAMSRLEEALQHLNLERHVVYSVTKFWSFPNILANTDLVAILPVVFARYLQQYFPLDIFPMPFEYPEEQVYMTWKNNRTNDPSHQWLRNQIITTFKKVMDQAQ